MNSVPGSFWMWVSTLDTGELVPLIFLSAILIGFVVAVTASVIYAMHKNRLDDALKRELLERGMTADEIATVVHAKPRKGLRREEL